MANKEQQHILIVEDEPFVLHSMEHFLGHQPKIKVHGCLTIKQATTSLNNLRPDLVISDIRLPDGLGLELLPILENLEPTPPILFVTGLYDIYKADIPEEGHIRCLKKPVSLQTIWDVSQSLMEQSDTEFNFKLTEYLQLACIGGHSVRLRWENQGEIVIFKGQLWSAKDPGGEGEPALKRMIVRSEIYGAHGRMSCKQVTNMNPGKRNVFAQLENLMLNAVFEVEQSNREHPSQEEATTDFQSIYDDAREALLERNYEWALKQFQQAQKLDPNHSAVNANIKRLQEMGIKVEEET